MGMLPLASLERAGFGLYEPAGGSRPGYRRKNHVVNCADPVAPALLLRYSTDAASDAATAIERAINRALEEGCSHRRFSEGAAV